MARGQRHRVRPGRRRRRWERRQAQAIVRGEAMATELVALVWAELARGFAAIGPSVVTRNDDGTFMHEWRVDR